MEHHHYARRYWPGLTPRLRNVHHKLTDGWKDGLTDATRTILLQLVSWANEKIKNKICLGVIWPPRVLHPYIKTPLHTLKYHQKSCMKQCAWKTFHINFLKNTHVITFDKESILAAAFSFISLPWLNCFQVHNSANSCRKSLAIVSFWSIRILLFE
jgi:hypothetical protein